MRSPVRREFVQREQAVVDSEELVGFICRERFESAGARCTGADVAGDIARDLLLADCVLHGGLEYGVDVRQRQRGEPLGAARSGGAATGLRTAGVDAAGAALAGGAELVQPAAYVLGGELGELLLAQARDEVLVDAGGVSGVGILAELVDGDGLQPVRRVRADAALRGGNGDSAVAGGDLLGELGQGFLAGGAVDADALASVARGEYVACGFPVAILALVDRSIAIGADAAGGVASRGVVIRWLPGRVGRG